ncbi:HlyD family secretion protein [Calothrix sp. NIES-4101]|nr:HlyD family secretion protein [Calothrix sp. NIES-4101]
MQVTNNSLNGQNKKIAIDQKMIANKQDLDAGTASGAGASLTTEAPFVTPETEQDKRQPAKGKKPLGLILGLLGVGVLAAGGFGYNYWHYATTHQETDNATVAGHINQVSSKIPGTVSEVLVSDNQLVQQGQLLVKLDPRDYQNKVQQAEASLQTAQRQAQAAAANITLASQTTNAKTAQAQGDVSGALAAISTAQAAVEEAQAGIPAAQAAVAEAQAGISAAQAQVKQANANLQKAEADYNRYNALFQQGAVAQQQLDTARAAYDVAVAQKSAAQQGVQQAQAKLSATKVGVAQAQSRLAQAREGVTSAQAKLAASKGGLQQATAGEQQTNVNRGQYEAAKASITQAQAALKDAQLQLSYTDITAPAAGRIGRKNVEVGNRVQVGTPMMAVVNNDYWVVANFKETQLGDIKPGEEVEVKLDAFPKHTFKGHVDSISPASGAQFALLPPDNATGNFTKIVQRIPVKIAFEPASIQGYESRISPGMSAEVSITVK